MNQRIELASAYILHTRPYRETSLLLDVFTHQHGRLSLIAKGVRSAKSPMKGILQPFMPLWISCFGRGDLLLLKQVEPRGVYWRLQGKALLCAFYVNELCARLIHRWDPHESLFTHYELALSQLCDGFDHQKVLRVFEKSLLKSLGYELPLTNDAQSGDKICPDHFYYFDIEKGPILVKNHVISPERVFCGKSLLALEQESFDDKQTLLDVKRLLRAILTFLLGNQVIETRKWL